MIIVTLVIARGRRVSYNPKFRPERLDNYE
jgi:hypothetical protein